MKTWLCVLAAFALLGASLPARAYVDTRTTSGTAVRWQVRCITMSPDARGDQSGDSITNDDIESTLQAAIDTWNTSLQTCSAMQLSMNPATQVLGVVSDGRPAVVFTSDNWSHDAAAIAVTTVWYANHAGDPTDGQISDADIELNAVNYSFTTTPTTAVARPNTSIADLQNTLTHELGHVMGLAHTCWDHKTATPPLDNNGQPAPDCNLAPDLPAAIMDATMYPYSQPGSTGMRVVGPDDLNGVCTSYPNNTQATACYGFIQSGGCQYGFARVPSTTTLVEWIVFAIVLFGGAMRWRSRRCARSVA
jgi:Metallo-peptidase family M12